MEGLTLALRQAATAIPPSSPMPMARLRGAALRDERFKGHRGARGERLPGLRRPNSGAACISALQKQAAFHGNVARAGSERVPARPTSARLTGWRLGVEGWGLGG